MNEEHKKYYGTHGTVFEDLPRTSYTVIDVLQCLWGKPWDDVAVAYVQALRPSCVRVTEGLCKADGWTNRVTVFIDEDNIITKIHQEVRVGLPEGVVHGEALDRALKYGIDSPQCQWYNDDTIESYYYDGINGGYYKMTPEGQIPFPTEEEDAKT